MQLSGLTQTVNTSEGGGIPAAIDGIPLFIGYSSSGTPETVYSFSDIDTLKSVLGSGPLVEAAARCLPGQVYCVPVTSDVAGVIGTITKTGSGPTITATGTPTDNGTILIKIATGGAVATATFQYSLDNGATWSQVTTTAATFLVLPTGVTVAFVAGTYVAAEVYTIPLSAPGYSSAKLASAFAAWIASTSSSEAEFLHIVGAAVDAAGAATMATAVQTLLVNAFAQQCYMSAIEELPDLAASSLTTALANVDAYLVNAIGGYCDLVSSVTTRVNKRPAAHAIVRRAAQTKPHIHLGKVMDGGIDGVTKLYFDERATPTFTAGRVTSLRTRPKKAGFYVEASKTLHGNTTHPLSDWHNVRVMLKAMRIAGAKLQDYINGDWDVKADGTLADAVADMIESEVQTALDTGLSGNCSRVVFKLNRTDKVSLTEKFRSKVAVQVKAYSKWIENEVAAVRTITTSN